jgi:hypothetical protein
MSIEHAVGFACAVGVGVDGITAVGVIVGATAVIAVEEGGTAVAVAVGDGVLVGGNGVSDGVALIENVGGGVGVSSA